jgi:hypothetical protein
VKLKDKLSFALREIDSVGLSNEYNTALDENMNPDLKSKCKAVFIFIELLSNSREN